jgi:hypothetical protein
MIGTGTPWSSLLSYRDHDKKLEREDLRQSKCHSILPFSPVFTNGFSLGDSLGPQKRHRSTELAAEQTIATTNPAAKICCDTVVEIAYAILVKIAENLRTFAG